MAITSDWTKSTKSVDTKDCVEVRRESETGEIEVRNSNRPHLGAIPFTDAEWAAFVEGVRDGEFGL